MNRVILAQIHTEITGAKSLTITVSGSMGQEKREPHPLLAVYDKMQRTLDTCRDAVNGRTPFAITQRRVVLRPI